MKTTRKSKYKISGSGSGSGSWSWSRSGSGSESWSRSWSWSWSWSWFRSGSESGSESRSRSRSGSGLWHMFYKQSFKDFIRSNQIMYSHSRDVLYIPVFHKASESSEPVENNRNAYQSSSKEQAKILSWLG